VRTNSTGSESQSSCFAGVKHSCGYTKAVTSVSKWGLSSVHVDLGLTLFPNQKEK
jgi:hypothetical protein